MEIILNIEFSNPYRNLNQRSLDHPQVGFYVVVSFPVFQALLTLDLCMKTAAIFRDMSHGSENVFTMF